MHPVLEKPFAVMGVVNVTPDSFYDGENTPRPPAPSIMRDSLPPKAPTFLTSEASPRGRARGP